MVLKGVVGIVCHLYPRVLVAPRLQSLLVIYRVIHFSSQNRLFENFQPLKSCGLQKAY